MIFKLITAKTIRTFRFEGLEGISAAVIGLFTGVGLIEGNDSAALLRYTSSFREALATFVSKWGSQCKYVNRLNDFFKQVIDGEHFAFVSHQPELPFGDFQSKNLNIQSYRLHLKCLANGIEYKPHTHTNFLATEGLALTRYRSLYFGYESEEVRIGEPDKRKRVCRYCGRQMPATTFKKDAHAIPDALGNKQLICNEECDKCNHRLSTIEESLTSHMEYNRVECLIPNKNGKIPEIEGRDFVVRRNADGTPQIIVDGSKTALRKNPDGSFSLRINGAKPIYDNDIYKTLVKCVIGLLPTEELPHFKNTIEWINGTLFGDSYPSIYKVYLNGVNVQPKCKIFLNQKQIPYSPTDLQSLPPDKLDSSVFVSKRPPSSKRREEVIFPEPDPQNITSVVITDPHISFSEGLHLTESMKRDVSIQCVPVIRIDPLNSRCIVVVDVYCMDTTNTIEYMRCSYNCNIYFKEFTRNIEICNDSLAFDYRLRDMLWTTACFVGEKFFAPQRAGTQFASFRLNDLADYPQLKENITYILPDGRECRSSDLQGISFVRK